MPGNHESQLQRVLERFQSEPGGRISIEAYAAPDEKEPQQLAATRAERVKQYLLEHGVAESQIQVLVGLGGMKGGVRNRTLDVIWFPEELDY